MYQNGHELTSSVMRSFNSMLCLLGAGLLAGCGQGSGTDVKPALPDAPASVAFHYERDVAPLFVTYCYDCHGDEMDKGGLALDTYADHAAMLKDQETWLKVRENMVTGQMPPSDKPQPSAEEFAVMKQWLDREMFNLDPDNPDPGRVTIRRLNRQEYNNSICDLVGVDINPGADFPQDNTGYGFDNIGDVLTLSPLLLEKYFAAAERILDEALVTAPPPPKVEVVASKKFDGGHMADDRVRALSDNGQTWFYHEFLSAGDYKVSVKAYAEQAGAEPAKMSMDVLGDGWPEKNFEVRAVKDQPAHYEMRVREKTPGRRKVVMEFTNDYYVAGRDGKPGEDRNLYVESVSIEGPLPERDFVEPESYKKIYVARPASEDDLEAAKKIIHHFCYRAFRRPPTEGEVSKLMGYVQLAQSNGDSLDTGIRLALQAVMVSPQFLFRGELQPQPDNPNEVVAITEYDLASRLSYFIWSSMPDAELLELAGKEALRENLRTQVERMLDDPRSVALAENFAGQWLHLRAMEMVRPDKEVYPKWDDRLRDAMIQETHLFFTSIQRENRSILDFIDADYTFVNEQLAEHYGIAGIKGAYFQRVRLDDRQRGGLLGQASVLTLTSNPTRTSPVKRGKWVLDILLGTPPPPAPPLVPPIEETEQNGEKLSFRRMLEIHAENPGCAGCHKLMDPIGLGLENFDGIGMWRNQVDGLEIDPAGQLGKGQAFSGFADLRDLLGEQTGLFVRCATKAMMTYALGRGLEITDELEVERAVNHVAQNDYRFTELVWAIVDSAPFQKRRGDPNTDVLANEPNAP